jgi:hypothetical protein
MQIWFALLPKHIEKLRTPYAFTRSMFGHKRSQEFLPMVLSTCIMNQDDPHEFSEKTWSFPFTFPIWAE